jgi:L-lactate dehydrogenase
VVILGAGVGQKPGETRLDLVKWNAAVFREVVPAVLGQAPDAVLVAATNPVDVMTHLAARAAARAGVPARRVFGSGTALDAARFRSLLGRHCGVDPHHVHGYGVGEHGDSEVLTGSLVSAGGVPPGAFARHPGPHLSDAVRPSADGQGRRAAYTIIGGKGAAYHGIGGAPARVAGGVLHDRRSTLTVCGPADDVYGVEEVTVALPRLVGAAGVAETFPLPVGEPERERRRARAALIRPALDELGDAP